MDNVLFFFRTLSSVGTFDFSAWANIISSLYIFIVTILEEITGKFITIPIIAARDQGSRTAASFTVKLILTGITLFVWMLPLWKQVSTDTSKFLERRKKGLVAVYRYQTL